jgi:hypothetical protein
MTAPSTTLTTVGDKSKPRVPWTKIEQYVVTYPTSTSRPRVHLSGASGEFAGQLVFAPNDADLPTDTDDRVYYQVEDFINVLDLLRNERPIYYINNGPQGPNGIQTGGTVRTSPTPAG